MKVCKSISLAKRPSGWTYRVYAAGKILAQGGGFATRRLAFGEAIERRCDAEEGVTP